MDSSILNSAVFTTTAALLGASKEHQFSKIFYFPSTGFSVKPFTSLFSHSATGVNKYLYEVFDTYNFFSHLTNFLVGLTKQFKVITPQLINSLDTSAILRMFSVLSFY